MPRLDLSLAGVWPASSTREADAHEVHWVGWGIERDVPVNESEFYLVHANVAIMRAPLDDPLMADFVNEADKIDALAWQAPGFVSQPTRVDEGQIFTGPVLLNLSIWESGESLDRFTHQGRQARTLARRAEWFEAIDGPNYVLYWAPAGHLPTEAEVKRRLDYLTVHVPTPFAFIFDQRFRPREELGYDPEGYLGEGEGAAKVRRGSHTEPGMEMQS